MVTEEDWPYPLTSEDMRWVFDFIDYVYEKEGFAGWEDYIDDLLERYPELKKTMPEGLMERLRVFGGLLGVGDLFRESRNGGKE